MKPGWESLLAGRTLAGRYRIEAPIGRGGMSVVYRAHDATLGRRVAVKVIALEADSAAARDRLRRRFRREAGAAAGIPPHPNLVHIYDYGTDAELDLDFIVMELLHGQDLKAVLAGGGLEPGQAVRVLLEAARGLAAGHRAGILHRDVKPANVFLVGDRQLEGVRVLDFGIAKPLEGDVEEELTRAGEAPPHSPAYASPEQLDPEVRLTQASDVYQLGLVGYETLAGERPFGEDDRERIRRGEDLGVPERGRWSSVPAEVRQVIERCLRTDPEGRYPDAASFAEALARAAGDGTALAMPPVSAGRAPHVRREEETLLDEGTAAQPASAVPAGSGAGGAAAAEAHPSPAGVPIVGGAPAEGRGPQPVVGRGHGGWHRGNTVRMLLAGAAALALVLVGALVFGRGGSDAPTRAAGPDVVALEAEFRDLQFAAARSLADETEAPQGAAAAEQVQRVIVDLYHAWAEGDMERFAAHYADRVDYLGRSRVRRSRIVRDRTRERERFDEVDITLDRQAVEIPEPDRARASTGAGGFVAPTSAGRAPLGRSSCSSTARGGG
jgi:predicted Ser/Thr protein kinase